MAAPVMTKSATGNVLAASTLAASKNVAVYRDDSANLQDDLTVRVTTGAAATSTAGCQVKVYYVSGSTTLTASASAGTTTLSVASATGIALGQKICVNSELRTVSAISGTTITIDALQSTQSSSVAVYLITQTARPSITLGAPSLAANTTYSDLFRLSTGTWVVAMTNTDASNSITAEMSAGVVTSFS